MSLCFAACSEGEFGKDCIHNCSGNCLNGAVCNKYNGSCESCSSGFDGPRCDKSKSIGPLQPYLLHNTSQVAHVNQHPRSFFLNLGIGIDFNRLYRPDPLDKKKVCYT